jgi:hypothetical protein
MTIWTWIFLTLMTLALVPLGWLAGRLVGMERVSLGRALGFGLLSGLAAYGSMHLVPFDFFVLKALAGVLGALLVSPLLYRVLMTGETARAFLASLLLVAAALALSVLLLVL